MQPLNSNRYGTDYPTGHAHLTDNLLDSGAIMILELTSAQRRELRARAHALHPVVMVADSGLTATVMQEIDRSLDSHELIKIRVFSDVHETRATLLKELCDTLSAAPVQHIGKILVVYRPHPEAHEPAKKHVRKRKQPRRTKRSFQG